MRTKVIAKDSSFIASLRTGLEFRRSLVISGLHARNAADDVGDSADLLSELVNECFWASIHVEEGRAVRGMVCVCSPDQAPLARAFAEPAPFSVKNVVALLTASPRSALAVHVSGNGLVIWGVLDATPMFSLRVRIAASGTVVVSIDGKVIAVYERGAEYLPKNGAEPLGWDLLVANALDKAMMFENRLRLATRFRRVVISMHRQGHGGALVVVPLASEIWVQHVKFKFRFDTAGSMAIQRRIAEIEEASKRCSDLEAAAGEGASIELLQLHKGCVTANVELLDTLLRTVGNLTAIDGAVVMDENLRLYGFGAKLDVAEEAIGSRVVRYDVLTGEGEQVPYSELGGTRHLSAARFVNLNHEAMVFVSSQDGRLTLFAWASDCSQVIAVTRLEHFIWDRDP